MHNSPVGQDSGILPQGLFVVVIVDEIATFDHHTKTQEDHFAVRSECRTGEEFTKQKSEVCVHACVYVNVYIHVGAHAHTRTHTHKIFFALCLLLLT